MAHPTLRPRRQPTRSVGSDRSVCGMCTYLFQVKSLHSHSLTDSPFRRPRLSDQRRKLLSISELFHPGQLELLDAL